MRHPIGQNITRRENLIHCRAPDAHDDGYPGMSLPHPVSAPACRANLPIMSQSKTWDDVETQSDREEALDPQFLPHTGPLKQHTRAFRTQVGMQSESMAFSGKRQPLHRHSSQRPGSDPEAKPYLRLERAQRIEHVSHGIHEEAHYGINITASQDRKDRSKLGCCACQFQQWTSEFICSESGVRTNTDGTNTVKFLSIHNDRATVLKEHTVVLALVTSSSVIFIRLRSEWSQLPYADPAEVV